MPIALNVGRSKAIYSENGGLEISCNVEVKIDFGSLGDMDDFDRTVEQAYFVCGQAINDELERQQQDVVGRNASAHNGNGDHLSN